jgi:hypothetical protein
VTSADIGAAPRANRPVGIQIARGIGFTVLLLLGLWAAVYVGAKLFFTDGSGESAFHPYWPAVGPVAVAALGPVLAYRRMRAWTERPRRLILCSALIVGTHS